MVLKFSKDRSAFILKGHAVFFDFWKLDDKGTMLIRNARNHSSALTASHHRRFEYSAKTQVLLSVVTLCSCIM